MKFKNSFFIFLLFPFLIQAQNKTWTLQECLQYAEKHNLQLKQSALQIEQGKIDKSTAKMAYLPTINTNLSTSWNSGLTQNFTTGILENQTTFGGSGSLGSNLNLFSGFKNRYNYKKTLLEILSAQYQYKDAVKNIQTQIASGFVQILLAKENLNNSKQQLENSIKQKERIEELIKAGAAPKGDLIDAKAQITNDMLQVVNAENNYKLAKLALAQLLELKDFENFSIVEDTSELKIDDRLLYEKPENLFTQAQESNYKLKNAETQKNIARYQTNLAKSRLYPSLSGFFNMNTRYSDRDKLGFGGMVTPADPLWSQVKDNRGVTYGLNLSIPVFNGLTARNQVKSAILNEERNNINYDLGRKQLRNDIYKMQADLKSAYQSLKATEANLKAQQKAYDYAMEKFKVGVMNIFDLNNVKLKYQKAQNQYINAKYQYFLKSKVLEYNIIR